MLSLLLSLESLEKFVWWWVVVGGGWWWWWVCKPISVFSLSLSQAEQFVMKHGTKLTATLKPLNGKQTHYVGRSPHPLHKLHQW